ncbi:Vacuolar cation-chloride cotransporter 1, partial [Coniosporium uncinatum]
MADAGDGPQRRRLPTRTRSTFLTRSAQDDSARLSRRASTAQEQDRPSADSIRRPLQDGSLYEPDQSSPIARKSQGSLLNLFWRSKQDHVGDQVEQAGDSPRVRRKSKSKSMNSTSLQHGHEDKEPSAVPMRPSSAAFPRPSSGAAKLGTFAGVFVPTTLNVLSILMFLRFGFILGQSGVVGMMGMLVACYVINLLTTMSVSAIATNGTVRGGGAYYLISRSLGPEFGGSIGIVFYLGSVFNTGMNAVGLIDCLTYNFGRSAGNWSKWLPDEFWWCYLWATIILVVCTAICLAGSSLFARASNGLLAILLVATFSIPFSAIVMTPFANPGLGIKYTGLSWNTFKDNLLPHFTRGADGSQLK